MLVHIRVPCRPTESLAKVKLAVLNLFPEASFTQEDDLLEASSPSADHLRDLIRAQKIRDAARAELRRGVRGAEIAFTLSKQAAYAGRVSFGSGAAPLGDIDVELDLGGEDPNATIDLLAESTLDRRREDPLR